MAYERIVWNTKECRVRGRWYRPIECCVNHVSNKTDYDTFIIIQTIAW